MLRCKTLLKKYAVSAIKPFRFEVIPQKWHSKWRGNCPRHLYYCASLL